LGDLLNTTQLHNLFNPIQVKAQIKICQLQLSYALDLFQIDPSYIYDGQDIQLLLHIPMVPSNTILWLLQLLPFLLPFTKTHFLLPKPANQIFVISSGIEHLSTELSMVNLMECHKINTMHICEEHSNLKKELNSTCLGSLYLQDFVRTWLFVK
jgi:hypothetical protein